MKKKYRLLKKLDFQNLLRGGNRIFTAHLICYWQQDPLGNTPKIGIIIPKKKCKLSCDRKKYKRVFWAINRGVLESLPGIKCVFFYKDIFFERYSKKELKFVSLKEEYVRLMESLSRKVR